MDETTIARLSAATGIAPERLRELLDEVRHALDRLAVDELFGGAAWVELQWVRGTDGQWTVRRADGGPGVPRDMRTFGQRARDRFREGLDLVWDDLASRFGVERRQLARASGSTQGRTVIVDDMAALLAIDRRATEHARLRRLVDERPPPPVLYVPLPEQLDNVSCCWPVRVAPLRDLAPRRVPVTVRARVVSRDRTPVRARPGGAARRPARAEPPATASP